MADIECPHCKLSVSVADHATTKLFCPQCGALLATEEPEHGGVASMFQPQLMGEEVDTSDIAADEESVEEETGSKTDPGAMKTIHIDASIKGAGTSVNVAVNAFLFHQGASPGQDRLQLTQERTVVGRSGADINVEDPSVSRSHFEIEVRGEEFFLRDLGSSNGTRLNGVRIDTAQLQSGDSIRAGGTTFVFRTIETIAWGS